MTTKRTYDLYTGENTICTIEELKQLENIYVEMFGLCANSKNATGFANILKILYQLKSKNNEMLSLTSEILPTDRNGFSVINIHNDFKINERQLPDVIFQTSNIKQDTVLLKKNDDFNTLQQEYNSARENEKCAVC